MLFLQGGNMRNIIRDRNFLSWMLPPTGLFKNNWLRHERNRNIKPFELGPFYQTTTKFWLKSNSSTYLSVFQVLHCFIQHHWHCDGTQSYTQISNYNLWDLNQTGGVLFLSSNGSYLSCRTSITSLKQRLVMSPQNIPNASCGYAVWCS